MNLIDGVLFLSLFGAAAALGLWIWSVSTAPSTSRIGSPNSQKRTPTAQAPNSERRSSPEHRWGHSENLARTIDGANLPRENRPLVELHETDDLISVPSDFLREFETYSPMWRHLGLNIDGMFHCGPIPRSLMDSCIMLASQPAAMHRYLQHGLMSSAIYYPKLAYGAGPFWSATVIDAWRAALQAGDAPSLNETSEHCIYSARAEHIAARTKLVFPYPFFSTRSVSANYPLIPLGQQTSIGLLVQNLTVFDKAIEKCEAASQLADTDDPAACAAGRDALCSLFRVLDEQDRTCVSRLGYAFDEIALEAIVEGCAPELGDKFAHWLQVVDVDPSEFSDEQSTGRPIAVPRAWRTYMGAYLFDPANNPSDEVLQLFPGTKKFIIRHGLRIPVGIGFSLPMLQELANPRVRTAFFQRLATVLPPPALDGVVWNVNTRIGQPT